MSLLMFTLAETASASLGSFGVSATCYRRAEDVRIVTVVIAPFEFRNIQRQIFAANFVEAAHNTAFQQRPEAVDCLSVHRAVNILASAMPNSTVFLQFAISWIIVSRDQANFFRDRFANEAVQGFCIGMCDNARHHIALAFDGADHGVLALSAGSWRALIPMPVFVFAANISFINFDDTHELAEFRFGEPSADAVTHIEGGRIGTEAKHPMHLQCGYALLAGQHKIDDLEPSPHRDIGVFKERSDKHGEAITEWGTLPALPMEWAF